MSAQTIFAIGGGAERGKSTLARGILRAANVPDEVPVIETSGHIYPLTKMVISWVIQPRPQTRTRQLMPQLLDALPNMFVQAGCDRFGIPDAAYRVIRELDCEDAHYVALDKAIAGVIRKPKKFRREITVETKSDFRPLMTAINRLLSEVFAVPWLKRNGYPNARNLWSVIGWQEIDDLARQYPDVEALGLSGARMIGDDDGLRDRNGYLLMRRRPITTKGDGLVTEHQYLVPDYVIDGDCTLDELAQFLTWFWSRLQGPDALPAGLAEARVYNVRETLAGL